MTDTTSADACISLAGLWQFDMTGTVPATPQSALPALTFADSVHLPGTTETNCKGPENPAREVERLTRVRHFEGPAWYQRTIAIPAAWQDKRVRLYLERTKYAQVWLDGQPVGNQAIYCTPQQYDLGAPTPGDHTLTVMVDNNLERRPVKCWDSHQYSDNTQTNWNGILGRIELRATARVWIEDVQVFPDVAGRSAVIRITVGNATEKAACGTVTIAAASWNHEGQSHCPPAVRQSFAVDGVFAKLDIPYPLGRHAKLWDEFSPSLYKLTVSLDAPGAMDEMVTDFGLRDFKHRDSQFTINGRTTFLRGKHDGCVFPLTGHPPMDTAGWIRYLRICRNYGINHIRCHSWTPPAAAFEAADRLGIYFLTELPYWASFSQADYDGLMSEASRIIRDYGNHPSFVMMTLGNELSGDRALMANMIDALRTADGRRLYACGSNYHFADPRLSPSDDFWATMYTRVPGSEEKMPVRGSFYDGDGMGIIQKQPPTTRRDYRASVAGIPVPVVGHEVAQYSMYPDYREIPKYTGVVQARNFEIFRERLAAAGMADQAADFTKASGALAAICYREEVEMALRTPRFGGFQLLDLQDFPGQGTALVGILNAFMESKDLIPAADWRQFCGPIVPLARFDKFTWTTAETLTVDIEIAHYGDDDILPAMLSWRLATGTSQIIAAGDLTAPVIKQGGLRAIGTISVPLTSVSAPSKLTLELKLAGTSAANTYSIWVYPAQLDTVSPAGLTVARSLDDNAIKALAAGDRVLLIPEFGKVAATVGGGFAPDFWCWKFGNKPGTLGLLCRPGHQALAGFPTEFHGNWQWFHLTMKSQPVILSEAPAGYRPIVQVIDNISRNHRLGLVFEARVLKGSLLVCATDLIAMQDRPEARQLLKSLTDYAGSKTFRPSQELSVDLLKRLLVAP